ncbi:MAG: molybdopterin-dependent oxidoreductase [Burkholderiales bacterium]|nr:molybdopterin-dependent oxidoreductase [Burkholderiales bacterium]MBH2015434.1 molybdopterin-dependent oxidoreductase [Burkholderiales bacterium]
MSRIPKIVDGPAQVAHDANDLPTVCVLCTHNCSLRVDVKDNAIVAVRGDETNPNTRGYTCNKARAIPNYVQHAQRLQYPRKRMPDGTFERISWDQAITEIAAKLNKIHKAHAPRSIALVGIGGQGNHMAGFGSLPFMFSLNSPMFFNALSQEKTQHALVWRRLYRALPDVYLHAEEETSDYMLLMGTNPLISNRGRNATEVFKELAGDSTRKLVVVDPRVSETAKRADRHIRIRPGCDVYLLMGMVSTILREKLHDEAYVNRRVKDFDKLVDGLSNIKPTDGPSSSWPRRSDARTCASMRWICLRCDTAAQPWPSRCRCSTPVACARLLSGNPPKSAWPPCSMRRPCLAPSKTSTTASWPWPRRGTARRPWPPPHIKGTRACGMPNRFTEKARSTCSSCSTRNAPCSPRNCRPSMAKPNWR